MWTDCYDFDICVEVLGARCKGSLSIQPQWNVLKLSMALNDVVFRDAELYKRKINQLMILVGKRTMELKLPHGLFWRRRRIK